MSIDRAVDLVRDEYIKKCRDEMVTDPVTAALQRVMEISALEYYLLISGEGGDYDPDHNRMDALRQ